MNVADLKIVKAVKASLDESFPGYFDLTISTGEVSKKNGVEKGDLSLSFNIPSNNVPELIDSDNFSLIIKKLISSKIGKPISWLSVDFSMCTETCKSESSLPFNISFRF